MVLWHAATLIREHRGDGHIAALLAAAPVEVFASRQWTDEQWAAARERLVARGWAGRPAQLVVPVTTAVVQSGLLPARTTLGITR